ncbi:DNA polymerase/3'-5' exonuclease PolX [Candidatus Daviesbacteria bacterium]|nr:DNA polymerase/3'-5' exonuclease PolX [Candidatus Daviesbacteria bacterium]
MAEESNFTNQQVASLLREVVAALTIKKGSIFQIRAYEGAADAIEHLTSEVKDLWEEDKLDQIPGVGTNIAKYLEELFQKGKVAHFESIKRGIEPQVFEFLDITGIGPKTALELAKLGVKDLKDLTQKIERGELVKKGFSEKIAQKIALSLKQGSAKTGRMFLPYAASYAQKILNYLKNCPDIIAVDPLGSLRRQVATIGDLDFAAASNEPEKVVEYFIKMPGVSRILDSGENKANIILNSGLEVDLLVGKPESYGALLQHFTGSKHHNIELRSLAQKKGISLSEYGVKDVNTDKLIATKTEGDLYQILGMDTPEPELRENTGEIEMALKHKLPKLIEFKDIKGDLHLHSSFPLEPSHDSGANSIEQIIEYAVKLGYKYVGISDHSPGFTTHDFFSASKLIQKRTEYIQKLASEYKKSIRVLNGLEIDILGDGSLSVANEALATLDYSIAGIHSGHRGTKEVITKRILTALENPYVDILAHPTGRLLNERPSYEADWEKIFKFCAKNKKLLEIDAFPNRLDLRDDLVRLALSFGVSFIINTDAHHIDQMENMPFGVSVARRGWAEAKSIVNTWDWKKFAEWFNIKE